MLLIILKMLFHLDYQTILKDIIIKIHTTRIENHPDILKFLPIKYQSLRDNNNPILFITLRLLKC
jgi:hypothetical protein